MHLPLTSATALDRVPPYLFFPTMTLHFVTIIAIIRRERRARFNAASRAHNGSIYLYTIVHVPPSALAHACTRTRARVYKRGIKCTRTHVRDPGIVARHRANSTIDSSPRSLVLLCFDSGGESGFAQPTTAPRLYHPTPRPSSPPSARDRSYRRSSLPRELESSLLSSAATAVPPSLYTAPSPSGFFGFLLGSAAIHI